MTDRGLNAAHIAALEARGIDIEVVLRHGLHTGRRTNEGDVVPDLRGNILVMPTIERGVEVAAKYRAPGKVFWQRKGGRKTFWNSDIMDDPAVLDGTAPLVITEGELDGIIGIQCWNPFVVSVPDGAPPVPKDRDPSDLDPLDDDSAGKFEFMWNNRERLKRIKRFVIAADGDPPGQRLAAELVRRLNPARCLFIEYPKEVFQFRDGAAAEVSRPCKDMNEVKMKFGAAAVATLIQSAKPYPVRGLYHLNEFPELPPIQTAKTGMDRLDKFLKPFIGELMIVLGIPGHGKSVFVANLLANLYDQYAWKSVIYSPEEPVVPFLRDKLRNIRARRSLMPIETVSIEAADEWIQDSFIFIAADPLGEGDDDFTLEWLIDRATEAVLRHGVKILVIDPWNEIEHTHRRGENQTEYTGRALRMLNRFRRTYGVMVIVLVHPTKEVGKDGKSRPPTPYDADGSANWYNKADHFVVVYRPDKEKDESLIKVAKVKFAGTGEEGFVKLGFNRESSRYFTLKEDEDDQKRIALEKPLSSGELIK